MENLKSRMSAEQAEVMKSKSKENLKEREGCMFDFENSSISDEGIETAVKYLSEDFGVIKLTSDGEDELYLTISRMIDHLFVEDKAKASLATFHLLKGLQKVKINALNQEFPDATEYHIHQIGMIENILIKLRNLSKV